MATKKPPVKKVVAKKVVAKKTPVKKTVAAKTEPKLKVKATGPKEAATKRGEPYVSIVSIELDKDDVGNGAFELDWNEYFVARLVKAGYMMNKDDTDAEIVDRWFQNVCRHVVMETWEQEQAIIKGAGQYVNTRDIGDGRTEVS